MQVIQTPKQHMYLAHLMGYDYQIQYRSGANNQVTDALSRLPEQNASTLLILSIPCLTFMGDLHQQLANLPKYLR